MWVISGWVALSWWHVIRSFHRDFQLLIRTTLGKIRRHRRWKKNAFWCVKLPSLKVTLLKTNSYSVRCIQSRNFTEYKLAPATQTSVNFRNLRSYMYIFAPLSCITFKLSKFTNFMALFPAVWTDFAKWSWSTWENPWRGLLKIDKKKKKKKTIRANKSSKIYCSAFSYFLYFRTL